MAFFHHIPRTEARAALLSVGVGITVLAVKFFAYVITGSSAIFADAIESIVNVLAAGFALYAVALAHQPADRDHPYGHGKIEFLSAGFEGGMILLAAGVMVVQAVLEVLRGHAVVSRHLDGAMLMLAGVMTVHAILGLYLIRTGKKRGALTLEADGHHLASDAVTSAVALAALLVVRWTHWPWADTLGAFGVAAYITITGSHLVSRSMAGLMDQQDLADEKLLRGILDAHVGEGGHQPRICAYHKLRHRHSGRYHWIDFHIVVPGRWDIAHGHDVASEIEEEIERAVHEGNATAHVEPCSREDCPACHRLNGNTAAGDAAAHVPRASAS